MNDDWIETTLGEVASWGAGGTPKSGDPRYYEGGSIPWAVIADVQDRPLRVTEKRITEAGAKVIGHLAPATAVLVTMYGTIGRVAITECEMATNQAIAWGVADEGLVTPEFLFHWLRNFQPTLDSLARGATQRNINRAILKGSPIALPPLRVQRRIVDLMAHLDNQIANLRTERKAALNLHQATKSTLLVAADDWLSGVVDDFIRIQVGFPFKSVLFTESEEDLYLLRGDNIEPGGLRWLRAKRWPVQMLPEVATYLLNAGDVVIAMDRTWISSGLKVAVVSEADLPALLVQRVARLTAKENLLQELVPFYFDSPHFENLVRHEQTGTSVPHISAKQIGSMPMSIPRDYLEQTRLAKLLSDSRSHVDALDFESAALSHVRGNLLAGLLAGRLAVDEGYDSLLDGVA